MRRQEKRPCQKGLMTKRQKIKFVAVFTSRYDMRNHKELVVLTYSRQEAMSEAMRAFGKWGGNINIYYDSDRRGQNPLMTWAHSIGKIVHRT